MNDTTFDYIIVGAGTAGCLLANRLSANASKRVLLIEAGRKDDYHWVHIPVGYLYCIGNPRTDWLYNTEPAAGLNGRSLRYPRGKVLGGCSSINGMIYMRGQSRDYDHWAEVTGDARWRWDSSLPYFTRHEDHYKGGDALHGAGGEWRVEKQRLSWDVLDAFAQAAVQAGIPATDDFNRGSNEGVGYFEVNQKSGWRWNTAKAFTTRPCAITTRAASGASKNSACAGTFSTPLPRPQYKPASPPPTTSTKAPTKAWVTSRSTKKAVGAGTPPKLFYARPAMGD